MAPRKVSKKRPAIDSKVIQLEARTRTAQERARRAKEQAKEARKRFKQAKKTAKRAKDEYHDLSTKLKGLLGSAAHKVSATAKSGKGKRRKTQVTKRPAVAVTRKKHVKAVAPAAKAGNPASKRSAITRRKAAKPKPVAPKKHAAVRERSAPVVRAPEAVPKRRLVGSGPKQSRPEASLPAEPASQPAEPSESGTESAEKASNRHIQSAHSG